MRRWRVGALALLMIASCSSSNDKRGRCERLRDHVVELRLHGVTTAGAQGDPARILAAHRAALKRALGDDFIGRCERLSSEEVECGIAASDHTSLLACNATAHK
jgi:hypothetical protein